MPALALSACTGDDAAPTTTLAPVTIPDPTTSTTATTTVTTTESVVATTGTTVAVPTTTITEAAAKQAVIAAAIESWRVLNEARLDPTNDDKLAAVAALRTGDALEAAVQLIADLRLTNQIEITNPDLPATAVPYPESVIVDLAKSTATVDYCRLGSNIWIERNGNPDGSNRVIDDTVNSYLEHDTFILSNGAWLKSRGESVAKYEGATTCPDLA